MATGYFKLYRPLQDHWVYSDSRYLHLWIDCLINARWSTEHKKDVYKGVMYTIERGQFLFSRKTYSDRLKIDESVIRRCIEMMIKEDMISVVLSLGKNKPTIYQVTNFDRYNPLNEPSESVDNRGFQVYINPVETQSKPSGDPVETTKEESNKAIRKKQNIHCVENYFQNAELNKCFLDFIEFRKQIKKPMSDLAKTKMIKKLSEISKTDDEKIRILENSIINNWSGVFALMENKQIKQTTNNYSNGFNDYYEED